MSTIADVAARAGVSKATASRALSGRGYVLDETRERVREAADALSYVAHSSAKSLATGRTQTVGVVMPRVDRWFFAEVLAGIQHELFAADYDLALYGIPSDDRRRERMFTTVLPRRRFEGIIAVGIQPDAVELEQLRRAQRPLVSVGPLSDNVTSIAIDDRAAGRIATEHLIELGHTDITFLGAAGVVHAHSFGDDRRIDGYREALASAGLSSAERVIEAPPTMPGGYAAGAELLGDRRNRPTAIVGVCDEAATGAMIAARRIGIAVPTELSIVGIDDHAYAEMFALTTIRQAPREQGVEAVRMLRERIEHPDAVVGQLVAPAALVVRASTAPPR